MLHKFLTANRQDLITRCVSKANRRDLPLVASAEAKHGVPLFLEQLVEALRREVASGAATRGNSDSSRALLAESSRTAALHGKALLEQGYSVAQVVHGYGDVCQAITELAKEKAAPVTVDEFHTLNRLLDNAIADAVSSYGRHRDQASARGAQSLHEWIGTLAEEQRDLLDTALRALEAVKTGSIGLKGGTGTLLEDSLLKLRDLIDKSLREMLPLSGTAAPERTRRNQPAR
jgi:hypothetical protein